MGDSAGFRRPYENRGLDGTSLARRFDDNDREVVFASR